MICSKWAADTLGLFKQDKANGICAADIEQIIVQLANNAVNEITETMTCLKSTTDALESCKQGNTNGLCADDTGQITR